MRLVISDLTIEKNQSRLSTNTELHKDVLKVHDSRKLSAAGGRMHLNRILENRITASRPVLGYVQLMTLKPVYWIYAVAG